MPPREFNLKAYAAITWHNDRASPGLKPRLADHRSQAARTATLPTAPPRQAQLRYINFAIFCQIGRVEPMVHKCLLSVKKYPPWKLCFGGKFLLPVKNYPTMKFMLAAATAITDVPYACWPVKTSSPENLLLLLCVCCWRAICSRLLSFVLRYRQWNCLLYLKWPSKVTQGHWERHASLDHPDFRSETGSVGYSYFQTKPAEMVLKVDQGYWRWRSSIGHIALSISGL